jgi:hypothetical protein
MKNHIQSIFKLFGFELHRTDGRGTLGGALRHLKERGFSPAHVVDGGASDGRWARIAQRYFPAAHYTLVEMQPQYDSALRQVQHGTVVIGALGSIPLDSLLQDPEHTLVKLDLDGAEPPVLAASQKLSRMPAVIMECPFYQLPEKCSYMAQQGFVVSRIFDLNYGPDGAMTQVDILFVSPTSGLV